VSTRGRGGLLLKAIVGLLITVALVAVLLHFVDPRDVMRMLSRTRWPLYGAALGIWIVMYLVRTVRFVLLAPRTPFVTMLCIASVHNFLLRLLPMRAGDVSYAFLVRRTGNAGLGESLLGLLLLRVLDATVVVVVFTVTLALDSGTYLGDRRSGLLVASLAGALGLLLVFALPRLLRVVLRGSRRVVTLFGIQDRPVVDRALGHVDRSIETFARIGLSTTLKITGATVVLWLLTFTAFFVIMRAFTMPVGVTQTVLGSTAAVVTGFLPIGGIGSFGTLEAGWFLGFVLVGLDQQQAVASGFGVSLATFSYAALMGLVGWIGLPRGPRKTPTS